MRNIHTTITVPVKKRHQLAPRIVIFVLDPNSSTHTIILVPVNQLATRYGTCEFNPYSTTVQKGGGGSGGIGVNPMLKKVVANMQRLFGIKLTQKYYKIYIKRL